MPMSLILKKSGRSQIFILTTATLLLIFGIVATAQSGWLDKGASILKSISGEKETTGNTAGDISSAFKEAHIPLPKQLETVKSVLSKIGMSQSIDDLELKLNRAAEAATPKAKALFWDAITAMTFEDVQTIYKGPKDSATQYFKGKMTPALTEEMQPIVTDSLSQVGAIQTYDRVMGKYRELPLVPDVKADLTTYVLGKSLDGIFYYVAKEEAAIRENPLRQTTDLLKQVFGTP